MTFIKVKESLRLWILKWNSTSILLLLWTMPSDISGEARPPNALWCLESLDFFHFFKPSLKIFSFASVIAIFSSIHPNDPPLLLGQNNTYSLAYNRDQEINTPFGKGIRDNSGMATFARQGHRNWFVQIYGFVGTHVWERRGGEINKSNINHISNNSFKITRDDHHGKWKNIHSRDKNQGNSPPNRQCLTRRGASLTLK